MSKDERHPEWQTFPNNVAQTCKELREPAGQFGKSMVLCAQAAVTIEKLAAQRDKLQTVATNAAATIGAIYEWVERVEKAGGATSISGIASCHAMLTSLRKNAARTETLVMGPIRASLTSQEGRE